MGKLTERCTQQDIIARETSQMGACLEGDMCSEGRLETQRPFAINVLSGNQ